MRLLNEITSEAHQIHTIPLENEELTMELRFLSVVQIWVMNVTYKEKTINGVKLSLANLHMVSQNFPFDFLVEDTFGFGIDPFRQDDFEAGRCNLYILDPPDIAQVRGVEVEL